ASMILVRRRAWWFNKVPLSVTLVLALLDGGPFSAQAFVVLATIVLTVCAVGNYGYALNDLFDVDEDARLGRTNAAAAAGSPRMWAIIGASAVCAEMLAVAAAGALGAILTLLALCVTFAYSVPPLRIKERRWLGISADALSAHVYPAMLALLTVTHWGLRPVTTVLAVCVAVWSTAAGLRGILSHQLHTADQDRTAGLRTVVHDLGNERVEKFVLAALLPLEVAAFGGVLLSCSGGVILWLFVCLYLAYEIVKTVNGRFRVTAFRPQGQRYLPFLEESFYKAWGPVVLALDAARADAVYLLLVPAYALLFLPHLRIESGRFRLLMRSASVNPARESSGRSNGES
ncbi:MAG: UbiA prenyltransferase family proteinmethyltransferase family protein, partial [Candidatus Eremiobacteraeota bacterium]|nr:UbiA prenyltransferase family proteinmethyltransferase family protein [Candidatus Eremiobacteraeota bacterium]